MKILFHANTLNFRGTTVAVTDYARYNEEILGNDSVIVYNESQGYEKDMGTEAVVLHNLKQRFKINCYKEGELQKLIDKEKVDMAYFIKAGNKDGDLVTNTKLAIHAVFQNYEPHGDRYAYISEWLSNKMSDGKVPFVPHIVDLPLPKKDFRKALGIRPDQIVIGRLGGYYTFDIKFVKDYITKLVKDNDTFVFLMMGTDPFVSHPNVKFINEIHDVQRKADFINTCDAMLHARERGESFGLSIAEFLSLNKPVLAWNNGHDLNHLDMLKDSGLLYNDASHLNYMLHNLSEFKQDWTKRVEQYKPEAVMKKFKEVFLDANSF